jgi:hypothetical protein
LRMLLLRRMVLLVRYLDQSYPTVVGPAGVGCAACGKQSRSSCGKDVEVVAATVHNRNSMPQAVGWHYRFLGY